ncbi:MAG: tripartite tricarboxylate transporter substrate binding protein [Rhizobacter sp.]|nr:tripartite tricarboxylate transporter substrate binding protein [Rhizobacter sp.]
MARSLFSCFIAAAALASLGVAHAQSSYPNKPIRWVVPFAAGGPADLIARALGPKLNEALGQQVIIDNRGGGNSNIGHEIAARAAPDGYTILYVVPNVVTNPVLFKSTSVDPLKDLVPVAQLTTQSYVLMAAKNFAPKNMAEILAKAKGGGVTCASGGGLPTFGCEWLRSSTKADFLNVPYRGNAPALTDLMGGQVDILIDLFNTALPQIKAGSVKAIALTGRKRGQPLPDLPVINETLPDFVLLGWHGVMAPAGTPAPIIERLNAAFVKALGDPGVRKLITDTFIDVTPTSAAEFGKVVKEDFAKYQRIAHDAGIKPE